MKYEISDYLTIIALLFILAWMMKAVIDLPIVHISHSTMECVDVYSSDNWTCDNLPQKYEVILVE